MDCINVTYTMVLLIELDKAYICGAVLCSKKATTVTLNLRI